jgi:hypothetical protein
VERLVQKNGCVHASIDDDEHGRTSLAVHKDAYTATATRIVAAAFLRLRRCSIESILGYVVQENASNAPASIEARSAAAPAIPRVFLPEIDHSAPVRTKAAHTIQTDNGASDASQHFTIIIHPCKSLLREHFGYLSSPWITRAGVQPKWKRLHWRCAPGAGVSRRYSGNHPSDTSSAGMRQLT